MFCRFDLFLGTWKKEIRHKFDCENTDTSQCRAAVTATT